MKHLHRVLGWAIVLVLLGGCATTPLPESLDNPPSPQPTQALPAAGRPSPVPTLQVPDGASGPPDHAHIVLVYDNNALHDGLQAEWGFAAWIEYGDLTLLFDTGPDGSSLLGNLDRLDLDPQQIDVVLLSHAHADHIGGLMALLETGVRPVIYAPVAFPESFEQRIRASTELVEILDPVEIAPGLHSTGQLGGGPAEQALVVETSEGTVVVTGCAHPGILRIVRQAQTLVEGEIALVLGGFHLLDASEGSVDDIVATFREVGVRQVSPTHCTGERPIRQFAAEYGEDYIEGGAGRVYNIGGESISLEATVSPPQPTPTSLPDHTVCADGCDFETIQAAIDAGSVAAGDVIQVVDSIHTEAGILVGKSLTIRGQGVDDTAVQAGASAEIAPDRVFRILPGATVTLEAMTIRHGHPAECPQYGGGILNEGTLTLRDCSVRDNVASAGGGLMNNGSLTIVRCSVRDNVADGHGGENAMGKGSGGGIKNMVGPLTIVDSTISGNRCARNGGGIKVSCSGTLNLVNSTISGNHAEENGGGLEVRGVVTMTHSTIATNEAGRKGGGLYVKGTSDHVRGILDLTNTLIASNTPDDCLPGDNATFGANLHTLVGDGSCSPAYSGDPLLGPLDGNGGATRTHALLPGSPAIDAIPRAECALEVDQRGAPRPVAFQSAGSPCDVGAFEVQAGEGGAGLPVGAPSAPGAAQVADAVWPTGGWTMAAPEEQGMDSQILAAMLAEIHDQGHAIDSVQVVRNGYLVVDAYVHPFGPDRRHVVNSCTKSIVSALIGIAIEQGYIESVDRPLLEFFPDRTISNLDDAKRAITLRHVLNMATGLECRDSYLYRWRGLQEMRQAEDWIQFMLDLPMAEEPGTRFEYCNGASFLLSAILHEATGMSAADFAAAHLFGPLGIEDVEWPASPQGISLGWGGLRLRPHDMAKIGYLYLNGGRWEGEQVVPADWVRASTRKHSAATLQDGYGYQWWVSASGYYMALGYAGQFIFVVPEKNLVAVFVSDLEERDFYVPQQLLDRFVIPAAGASGPLPANPAGVAELEAKTASLAQP